ncbi:scaffold attachment factor B1 isoform X1 [Octopus sinensis]|uniref:Scaffold attachment factor B1 isoform X1 n=1 Tax=Octopus sinensis TaxID=2607531 RepID=A0A6P7T8Z8_9MOLL|nr:scaffold attachment factor B1 isoform X1 [Octopus sinensis]
MMANANGEISSEKLIDLRVVDLRNELEKRGLDKSGVKAVLLERLEQALKSEGETLEHTEGSKEKADTVPTNATDLGENEVLSEDKFQEESEPTDVLQNKSTADMDEKDAETSGVFSNTNPDTDSLLPGKTSVEDLSENQLLSSDTKPSDMLRNDTSDKDQFVEELPATTLDTNKETDAALQGESDDPLKNTMALPEQSSSSAETNTKEEKSEMSTSTENNTKEEDSKMSLSAENNTKEKRNSEMSSSTENNSKEENSEKSSSSASVKSTTSQKCNEIKGDKVAKTAVSESLPSTPRVKRKAPFALKDTVSMDTSNTQQGEENESLIVHVDDTQNDLDADLVASKDKVRGKTEAKKTDGSKVEERAKGKTEGGQTEKKADEKKDDKDVKSKSSSDSKPKVLKSIKSNNQNSRNLWVSGLASSTRATDLKKLFTTYGKVVGAKVVTNARSPGARCYGFVTMSSSHEATKCIQHLNQTELHGRMISVERARNEPGAQIIKMPETKTAEKKGEKAEVKKDEKKVGDKKEGVKKVDKKEPKKDDKDKRLLNRRDDKYRRISSRRSDKDRKTSSRKDDKKLPCNSSSHHKPSDKTHVTTPNKSTAKPTTSLKPATKEDSEKSAKPASPSSASIKEKASGTPKPKSQGSTTSSAKKDILSFDQIKKERERQRLHQRRRRLKEQERRHLRKLDQARSLQQDFDRKQKEKALKLERVREDLRRERQRLEKELLQTERYKLAQEFLERERVREEQHRAELMRLEEMRRSMKRPYEEELWDEPKRSRMSNSSNPSRFELPFQNESRYREYEHADDERRVECYERRESRTLDGGGHFDERKEREMTRREVSHVRNIRERNERRTDVRSRTDENFNRTPYEFRRDTGLSRERFISSDQGRDSDRRNISAHDRLGRVRSSPVGGPDQRPWGSGGVDRKVDNWSHMQGNVGNSGMNRSNGRWLGDSMNTTGHNATGAFVDNGRPGNNEGMGQNSRPGNMFSSSQSQGGMMMNTHGGGNFGGNNMGGRMQQPCFDA